MLQRLSREVEDEWSLESSQMDPSVRTRECKQKTNHGIAFEACKSVWGKDEARLASTTALMAAGIDRLGLSRGCPFAE